MNDAAKISPWKKWLTAIVILAALAVAAFWVSCVEPCRFPTNQQVLARWQKDRQTIFALRDFLKNDSFDNIRDSGVMSKDTIKTVTSQDAGVTPQVITQIRKQMTSCRVAVMGKREDEMYFGIGACGFASKGWRLSFVYRTSPPPDVLKSLDDFRRTSGKNWTTAYVPLEKNWYVRVIW